MKYFNQSFFKDMMEFSVSIRFIILVFVRCSTLGLAICDLRANLIAFHWMKLQTRIKLQLHSNDFLIQVQSNIIYGYVTYERPILIENE